jgi:hypothetical protein
MKKINAQIFLMFLVPLLSTLVPDLNADALAEKQARFGVITGDVGLLSQGASDWIEAHEGLPLEPGDRIRTGEDGRAEIIAGENELWMMEPQTELVTEHMETNAGRFNLESGALLGRVDSSRTAGTVQRWEFNTPAAVAAIRGTEFALDVSKAGGSSLGVLEGTVDFQAAETAEGLRPPVQVSQGQEAQARRGKPIITLAKFSPRMQALAGKRPILQRRQLQIQNTWSPFTPAVRTELRRKFVAPPPKARPTRPRPSHPRRRVT